MRRGAYYNEHDPFAAAWLRNLISAGHIAPGDVDERDIRDIQPDDLRGYVQCHFFAGIGVWSYALRNAGWTDDRPIWTGSCPCQPFSSAGRGDGFADERHLWPYWHWLIAQLRPPVVAGEQVASKDGLGWLDLVSADLEGTNYAFGASDLCAAGFDGAHIRQRLYFAAIDRLADAENSNGRGGEPGAETGTRSDGERGRRSPSRGVVRGLADANGDRHDARITGDRCAEESERGPHRNLDDRRGGAGGLVDVQQQRLEGHARDGSRGGEPRRVQPDTPGSTAEAGSAGGLADAEREQRRQIGSIAGGSGSGSAAQGLDERPLHGRDECRRVADADSRECGRIADGEGRQPDRQAPRRQQGDGQPQPSGELRGMANSNGRHPSAERQQSGGQHGQLAADSGDGTGRAHAPMLGRDAADWLYCRDGKWRPVEPGTFPLVDQTPSRVGRLRAYGNALDAETATQFVGAVKAIDDFMAVV